MLRSFERRMTNVVVIRPGCTDFDEQHRLQGSLDLPLNDLGKQQVARLAAELADAPLEVLYTGPCEPAKTTADTIGELQGIPVKEIAELCNVNQGLWQGLQLEEIRRKFPKVYKQWHESPEKICPPEGETLTEAVERIEKALHKPLKRKKAFGIVASEPLATLVGCVLRGSKPELPQDLSETSRTALVERLETNGKNLPPGAAEGVNGQTDSSEAAISLARGQSQ